MAADMCIHVMDGIDEEDLKHFFSNNLGSRWANPRFYGEVRPGDDEYIRTHPIPENARVFRERMQEIVAKNGAESFAARELDAHDVAYDRVCNTPSVHVGEVSWLKAAIFEDPDAYIPDPVAKVSELIGDYLPVIDDALIDKMREALDLPNRSGYSVGETDPIIAFLEQHKGKRCFTVSW